MFVVETVFVQMYFVRYYENCLTDVSLVVDCERERASECVRAVKKVF